MADWRSQLQTASESDIEERLVDNKVLSIILDTMFARPFVRRSIQISRWSVFRPVSTLQGHPYIYVFPDGKSPVPGHLLSLLPSEPPNPELAIGSTNKLPPAPDSFRENPAFLKILQEVLAEHAHEDPETISQAQVMASTSGANLGSGGVLLTGATGSRRRRRGDDSSGGASHQGGVGSAGRGGWIHVSDSRNPPEYGRIAWPEDIFGSLEVDGQGRFVNGNGNYQPSGTYRMVTRNGILGLSPFLREKLVERLREQSARPSRN